MRKIVTIAFLFSWLMAQKAVITLPSGYRLELPHTNNIQFDTIRVKLGATFTAESPADFLPTIVTGSGTIITGQPLVSAVSSSTSDGAYNAGDTLLITVTFSENVTVTGTPQLTLETGSTDAVLNYVSGSGTAILVFRYIVASGHTSADLAYGSTTALALPDTTVKIRDNLANDGVLTLPVPGATNSLQANKALVIDTELPTAGTVNDGSGTDITYTNSSTSLTANWTGFSDALSGIASYKAAIEDAAGSSVVAWTDVGNINTWTATGLSLNNATTYHAVIRAADVAGNLSTAVSTNGVTVDIDGPVIGYVLDGDTGDIDWTNDTTALSLTWDGFSDTLSGLSYYEYAVGITTGGAETISWTSKSRLDSTVTESGLSLTNTTTYFASVRAVDSVANVSESAVSDGITIDTFAPLISDVLEGSLTEDIDFQNSDSTLIITWSGEDDASGISIYEYALGSSSGGTEVLDWTGSGTATADTLTGLELMENQTYHVNVRATDNAGNLSDVMTGDGILIDMTPPSLGSVLDGPDDDLVFTGSDSSLTANWSDFQDLVSGVLGYEIAVNESDVYPWTWIGDVLSYTITGLALDHAASYTVNVRATDNAGNVSAAGSSDGIIVDTDPPTSVVTIVLDYYNEAGWAEDTTINGIAGDEELQSGLSFVEVSIMDQSNATYWTGSGWSVSEDWLLAVGGDTWTYDLSAGSLTDGTAYEVRSRATDAVGNLQTNYGLDTLTYDTTEPNTTLDIPDMYYNSVGWNSAAPLQGTAGDGTSGIAAVYVLIQRDSDDLYYNGGDWTVSELWQDAADTENWSYDLPATNLDDGLIYFIQVRAEDVAGNVETTFASDNFTYDITPPNSEVLIERDFYNNINWSDANSISGTASDSTSGLSSISISILRNSDNSWWGGTNWTSSESWHAPDGVASWTYALNGNNLTNGVSYTIYARAEDVANNVQVEFGEDTFTYDLTSPIAGQVNDGLETMDQDWSNSTTTLAANWSNFQDVTSGITKYEYSAGTTPAATDVIYWTDNGTDTTFTDSVTVSGGTTYYISVRATDGAENVSSIVTSDGITIDSSNPMVSDVYEGAIEQDMDYQQDGTALIVAWTGARDITGFRATLGSSAGDSNVVAWVDVGNVTNHTFSGLNLVEATTYYASVQAEDLAGNLSDIISGDGITIDQSGPVPGQLNDGTAEDIDWVNINYLSVGNWTGFTDSLSGIGEYEYSLGLSPGQTQVVSWTSANLDTAITVSASLTEGPTYYANVRAVDSVLNVGDLVSSDGFGLDVSVPVTGNVYDGLADDLSWTNIIDSIWANWEGFSDLYSGISFYETAVGTSPGGQNTVSWVSADTNISTSHAELSLEHGSTYYFSVRATDVVENVSSPGMSNGITIDTLFPVINLMAETSSEDPLFQGSDSSITLFWAADDDLSGIEHYDYALGSSAGETDLVAWTNAGTDLSITMGDLVLDEGSKYYGSIRVYDQAGNMTEANGNGVTIDITAPDTGSGMDITDINNTADQSYTSSTTMLQASWDGFADNLSGIAIYEYGVGSASLQTDIQDWISVGLDTFMLNSSFTLDNGDTYYISIRAIDSVGNVSDAISTDGIIADHEGPFGSLAIDGDSVDIDRQNFTDVYTGHWSAFEDQLSGLVFYEVAIYDSTSASYTVLWDSLGLDTLVEFMDLTLIQDHEYKLHIRGVDHVQNTGSIIASDGVLIDQTAPQAPQSLVGFFSSERIYLSWDSNLEPDLSHYNVYGGADSLQPVTVLQTGDTEAEAFLPEFSNNEDIFLHITATDIPGNESPKSNWVQGIPQPAMVTRILPDTSITILKDDNTFSIHFSQPLSDIGTVTTTSLAYSSMNLEAIYSDGDTSIKITVNDPWASMDTVTFSINNILDWAGSGTNEKTATFTTYLLGDYNNDFSVDVADLSSFVTAWNNDDYSYELGPVTGTAPHFIPALDSLFTVRDAMTFSRMWYWSNTSAMNIIAMRSAVGAPIEVDQSGRKIIIKLPDEIVASEIAIEYPIENMEFSYQSETSQENDIMLSKQFAEEQVFMQLNGFITASDLPIGREIMFDISGSPDHEIELVIHYRFIGSGSETIGSGSYRLNYLPMPDEFSLYQNYPNPFNPVTQIKYDLPEASHVQLFIYDILGREVTSLVNEVQEPGYRSITWHGTDAFGRNVSAGMYFYSIQAGDFRQVKKMVLLK